MSEEIYEKGKCYATDVSGCEPLSFPTGTYIPCDDTRELQIHLGLNHISCYEFEKHVESLLPFAHSETECVYMTKTVIIERTIKIKVID